MKYHASAVLMSAAVLFGFWPRDSVAQQAGKEAKIFKSITPDELEKLLSEIKIKFKKSVSKTKKDTFFYDYTNRNGFKLRLGLHDDGKILWVDALFNEISLEAVNNWNRRAKFGRAVREKQKSGKVISIIEWQLDVYGGCTNAMIQAYLRQFDVEVGNFKKHVDNNNKSF